MYEGVTRHPPIPLLYSHALRHSNAIATSKSLRNEIQSFILSFSCEILRKRPYEMFRKLFIVLVVILLLHDVVSSAKSQESSAKKKKKDLTDYNEADLERLFQQWEENDEEKLDDDELPEHKRRQKQMDLDSIRAKAKNPEELLSETKKGQTVMMFVNIRDPSSPSAKNRPYTEKTADVFQAMLRNNHIICQTFLIDDDRAIFMFEEGSQAFEAKNFLLKQEQITEITLEGQTYVGAGKKKEEL